MSGNSAVPKRFVLSRWLVPDGSIVRRDQPICEVESEDVSVELAAPAAGMLRHLKAAGEAFGPGDSGRVEPRGDANDSSR